jgi:hypothetical protein
MVVREGVPGQRRQQARIPRTVGRHTNTDSRNWNSGMNATVQLMVAMVRSAFSGQMMGMELREKDTMAHSCSAAYTATQPSDPKKPIQYASGTP